MKFLKLRPVKSPVRGTPESAGIDFFVPDDFGRRILSPDASINIPSGLKVQLPKGYALVMMNKSGVATKQSLLVGACVVDEDYQGEIHLHVINCGKYPQSIDPGQKLVQGVLIPVGCHLPEEVKSIEELYDGVQTERGTGGFGSTGI